MHGNMDDVTQRIACVIRKVYLSAGVQKDLYPRFVINSLFIFSRISRLTTAPQ